MLVVDPMKRMTIPEIRQHLWFQAHLPRYLAVPPPDTLQQAKKVRGLSLSLNCLCYNNCTVNLKKKKKEEEEEDKNMYCLFFIKSLFIGKCLVVCMDMGNLLTLLILCSCKITWELSNILVILCSVVFVLLWSSLVFNSAVNMLSCRLTRTFYRKWLRRDLTGTNWLNLFGTGYKIRFRPFQTIFSLQILKLYVLFLVSFFRLLLLTICYWTTGFVLLVAILELSSKRLWCVYSLISYFVLLNFQLAIFLVWESHLEPPFDPILWIAFSELPQEIDRHKLCNSILC